MGHFSRSVTIWQRALDSLPVENATPAEIKQREQYDISLKAARTAHANQVTESIKATPKETPKNLPWELAKPMLEEPAFRQGAGIRSSVSLMHNILSVPRHSHWYSWWLQAWVISAAYQASVAAIVMISA